MVMGVLSVLAAGLPAASSPPFVPACESVELSPEFVVDHKAFCVAFDPSDGDESTYRFFTTRDGGRTWERRPATGFSVTADNYMGSLLVSPGYADDRTVYVQTNAGVFGTTDDGETFTFVDRLATRGPSGPNLGVYLDDSLTPGGSSGPRPVLVLAAGDNSMKIDPPLRTPVAGAPFDERRFLFPTGGVEEWTAFTMTVEVEQGVEIRGRNVLFGCDEQLVCAQQLFAFPWGQQIDPRGGIWFASDFAESRRVYVTTGKVFEGSSSLTAWTSTDGGATFRRWTSVNEMLRPLRRLSTSKPFIGLAVHPSRPRTMYMRLSYTLSLQESPEGTPPIERFFVSNDRGRTWTRLSFARDGRQRGPRGTIPWDGEWGAVEEGYTAVAGDGTLFVMASRLGGHDGLYCSTDGGRHWAPLCPSL